MAVIVRVPVAVPMIMVMIIVPVMVIITGAVMIILMLVIIAVMVMIIVMGVTVVVIMGMIVTMRTVLIICGRRIGQREAFQLHAVKHASRFRIEGRPGPVTQGILGRPDQRRFGLVARCALEPGQIVERALQLGEQRAIRIERDGQLGKAVHMGASLARLVSQRSRCGRGHEKGGDARAFHDVSPLSEKGAGDSAQSAP